MPKKTNSSNLILYLAVFGLLAKGFGSYIGEVYRRNHGGEWGIVDLGGQKLPGLCFLLSGLIWIAG